MNRSIIETLPSQRLVQRKLCNSAIVTLVLVLMELFLSCLVSMALTIQWGFSILMVVSLRWFIFLTNIFVQLHTVWLTDKFVLFLWFTLFFLRCVAMECDVLLNSFLSLRVYMGGTGMIIFHKLLLFCFLYLVASGIVVLGQFFRKHLIFADKNFLFRWNQ